MNNNTGRKRVRRARKNESIKRIILTVCMMAMIAAVSIGGTLAWLTDYTPEVKNVFTPTNIDIELNESKNLNLVMIPGGTITKDPTITINKDSESLWLFVKMEKANDFDSFMEYEMADNWELVGGTTNVYCQQLNAPFADPTSIQVIADNTVTVKSSVTKEMMDKLYDDTSKDKDLHPSLTVTAYAIQQANLGENATAKDAWDLLNAQYAEQEDGSKYTYMDPNKLPFGTQTTTIGGEEDNGEG